MRIVIVGAGALGGFIGACLKKAGEDVTLIANNPARIRLINKDGLYLAEGEKGESCIRIKLVSSCEGAPADLIFLAVKSYQTREALRSVTSLISDKTHVLSLQNGLGNVEIMAEEVSPDQVSCGITYHSVQDVGANRLRYRTGIKPIQVAPYNEQGRPGLEKVVAAFSSAGLKMEIVPNVDVAIWQKLLHNAVINPVSAVTGRTCREMLEDGELQNFMRALCYEIVEVMKARGLEIIHPEDPYLPVINSQKALGKNRPSMWQDLVRGRRTEVDSINGAVILEAEKYGLSAPLNWGLVRFIHSREHWKINTRKQDSKTLRKAIGVTKPSSAALIIPGAGMPKGRVPLETAPKLKELLGSYYRDLEAASEDPKRQVVWTSGLGPVEILRAFDMATYYPENHACLIGASRQTGRYIPRAIAEGFSQFISSAMACDIGAMLVGDSPLNKVYGISGPPPPDLIAYSTNNGRDLLHWFEYYGRHFAVPVLGLHPPPALDLVDRHSVSATSHHLLGLIDRLESIAVKRLDLCRLRDVVRLSAKAARLWGDIINLSRHVPSPITFFDMLIHMAPIVIMRGTPQAVEYYQILKAELEDRVACNQAAVPGERYRLFWEGPPIWGALRPLAELFLSKQTAVVASTFCSFPAGLDVLEANNPIESMARAYLGIFPNRSEKYKEHWLKQQFKGWGIDAVMFHEGRTSPEHSNVRYGLAQRLGEETGLPSLVVEADTHDQRLFSLDQVRSQLTGFIENIKESSPSSYAVLGECL